MYEVTYWQAHLGISFAASYGQAGRKVQEISVVYGDSGHGATLRP